MNEVSRIAVLSVVDLARGAGHPCARVFDGLPFTEAELRGPRRRMDWAHFIAIAEALTEEAGGSEPLAEIAAGLQHDTSLQWAMSAFVSPTDVFRFWDYITPSVWTNVRSRSEELPDGAVRVTLTVQPGFASAVPWFASLHGSIATMCCRIGLPRAEVAAVEVGPSRASWVVRTPASRTIPARIRQAVVDWTWLEELRHVAESLDAAQREAPDLDARADAAARAWQLTPTQTAVMRRMVRGLSNKEIAADLGNAEATVEVHVTHVLRKSGAPGRAALVSRILSRR